MFTINESSSDTAYPLEETIVITTDGKRQMLGDGARVDATMKKPRVEDDSRIQTDAWNAIPREDQRAILAARRSLSDSKPKGNTKKTRHATARETV